MYLIGDDFLVNRIPGSSLYYNDPYRVCSICGGFCRMWFHRTLTLEYVNPIDGIWFECKRCGQLYMYNTDLEKRYRLHLEDDQPMPEFIKQYLLDSNAIFIKGKYSGDFMKWKNMDNQWG